MMPISIMNEVVLVKLLVLMFGYVGVTLLITGIICVVLDYIDNKKG